MALPNATAGPSTAPLNTSKFIVQSTDVLQEMRVNVTDESSGKVVYYKERFLNEHEIVDNVVHNYTSRIVWTIHRPRKQKGWYIRMRSPAFPPGAAIQLGPVARKSAYWVDGALSFKSRTNVPSPIPPPMGTGNGNGEPESNSHASNSSTSTVHSYPPTPPAVSTTHTPPSPAQVQARLDEAAAGVTPNKNKSKSKKKRVEGTGTQITEFVLAPHSAQPAPQTSSQHQETPSLFSRAMNVLNRTKPSHSNSFTLSRVPQVAPTSPITPSSSATPDPLVPPAPEPASTAGTTESSAATLIPPLLTYHDRTPVYTAGTITGLLEIDMTEEQLLGVESSFWIAVALTYLAFLEERESYLAAQHD